MIRCIKIIGEATPEKVINALEKAFPECEGLCFYEDKELKSKDDNFIFNFDPFHNVAAVHTSGGLV